MNARTPLRWTLVASITFGVSQLGCNRSDSQNDPGATPYAASGGIPPQPPPEATATEGDEVLQTDAQRIAAEIPADQAASAPDDPNEHVQTPFTLAGADNDAAASKPAERSLPPDLSPQQLQEFLANADQDMQVIWSGRIADPQESRETLIRIVKLKMEASRRLAQHSDASPQEQSEGKRGQLQAMSHLASFGDLEVAEQLEKLAKENLESNDANLIADSRLVLIGFAIESLQNGKNESADEIVQYIDQISSSENPGVPAMMVMGQARQSLADYGHKQKSRHVRDAIIRLFAGSSNPQIATMAAQLAGNVRYDAIEELRELIMNGQAVAVARWREAADTLIDESADIQTVQYLAGAALEFESIENDELTTATYDILTKRFNDPQSATGREVSAATAARDARRKVVGTVFNPDLTSLDGSPLSMADFKGKLVVMPFWAMNFPESLQMISRLKEIQQAHQDDVAIVGMNLDVKEAPLEQFLLANDLGFPSFRSVSSPTAPVANPVVQQFGMVSMPFTAIIDQEGRVAALDFSGRTLQKTVEELVAR